MGQIAVLSQPEPLPPLSTAVEAFFADKDLAPNTRRTYRQALDGMTTDLGGDLPLDELSTTKVRRVLDQRWGQATPATWNTRITALQSFVRYCQRNEWLHQNPLAPIERRREPRDQTRAIPYDDLEALWSRRDIGLREKPCGGCCTKPPPAPTKSLLSTSRNSTEPANGLRLSAREATGR